MTFIFFSLYVKALRRRISKSFNIKVKSIMKFSDICGVCGTVNIYLLERMIDDHIQDLMVHDITF